MLLSGDLVHAWLSANERTREKNEAPVNESGLNLPVKGAHDYFVTAGFAVLYDVGCSVTVVTKVVAGR